MRVTPSPSVSSRYSYIPTKAQSRRMFGEMPVIPANDLYDPEAEELAYLKAELPGDRAFREALLILVIAGAVLMGAAFAVPLIGEWL